MTTEQKIYTAAEVQSVGFSKEGIDEALATITQKAYEAAKYGGSQVVHHSDNLNLLHETSKRLRELGYTTKIVERLVSNSFITVCWDFTKTGKENKK